MKEKYWKLFDELSEEAIKQKQLEQKQETRSILWFNFKNAFVTSLGSKTANILCYLLGVLTGYLFK